VQVTVDPYPAGARVEERVRHAVDVGVEETRGAPVERERRTGHLAELAPEGGRVARHQLTELAGQHLDDLVTALPGVHAASVFDQPGPGPRSGRPSE
jgi:hypothetical protein